MSNSTEIKEHISPGIHRIWSVDEVFFSGQTKYQQMLIGKTQQGTSLFCNNERQSTELSQEIYHEGQIYPAALLAGKIDSVLIIGSSEGVISHMAKDLGAKEVVHVDIDLECVKKCAELLPYGYTAEEVEKILVEKDGTIRLLIEDGYQYVQQCAANGKTFDIVVMDLPDEQTGEDAQQNRLYEVDFLKTIGKILSPEGAFITQAGCSTYWRNETLKKAWGRFHSAFPTRVMFEMEEQDWVWIVGMNEQVEAPVARMTNRLFQLKRKPRYIDEASIPKATTPPVSLRK